MNRYLLSVAVGSCLMVAGCGTRVDVDAERQALLDADRAWASAAAAGDLDRVLPYWAEDAVVYPAGLPAVRGKAAIREFVAKNRAQPAFSIAWEPLEAVVSRDGSLGYTVGDYEISIDGADGDVIARNGRYVETWRKNSSGSWKCILEIQAPLTAAGRPDLRPAQQPPDDSPQEVRGIEAAGALTPVGSPFEPPVRIDAGQSCIVEVRQAYAISGTLSGSVEIDYRILVAGPCGSPPGTFDEEWIAHGTFTGTVNETAASGTLSYTAQVSAGGDIDGQIVLGQGLEGVLSVHGNLGEGRLSYRGSVDHE